MKKHKTLKSTFLGIQNDTSLNDLVLETILSWYDAKHPKASNKEIALINSITIDECPFCNSKHICKNGKRKDGTQTYLCKSCSKRFNPLTNTIFDSHKIPISEWIEFLIQLFEYQSTLSSSFNNQNAYSTGRFWLKKVFVILEGYQDNIQLYGDVGVDECFVKGLPDDDVPGFPGMKMKDGKTTSICIYCATDKRNAILIPYGKGTGSCAGLKKTIIPHMKHASCFHDDGAYSHNIIKAILNIPRHSYPRIETANLKDKENPLNDINSLHRQFKKLVRSHGTFKRKNLYDYCNLQSFIYAHHGNKASMVIDLLKMSLKCKKLVRFRELFAKKSKFDEDF